MATTEISDGPAAGLVWTKRLGTSLGHPRQEARRWALVVVLSATTVVAKPALVLAQVAAAVPPIAAPVPPQAPPVEVASPQPPTVHRMRREWLIPGGVVFGLSWGLAVAGSLKLSWLSDADCTSSCRSASHLLWIPVAGPFLAQRADPSPGPPLAAVWSLVEGAGLAMLVVGLVGHDVPVHRLYPDGPLVTLFPTASRQLAGVMLSARF